MKIGIFGGTFNPVHFGHLNFAIEMLERRQLDQIWFCPAQQNPLKKEENPVDISHRLKMLTLAIEGNPDFKTLDIEAVRQGPSYTIDTINQLLSRKDHQYHLLIGEDHLSSFMQWKEAEQLATLLPIFVGSRSGQTIQWENWIPNPVIRQKLQNGVTSIHLMEISSTDIRKRLKKKLYCQHLVPIKVLDYIYENDLY